MKGDGNLLRPGCGWGCVRKAQPDDRTAVRGQVKAMTCLWCLANHWKWGRTMRHKRTVNYINRLRSKEMAQRFWSLKLCK